MYFFVSTRILGTECQPQKTRIFVVSLGLTNPFTRGVVDMGFFVGCYTELVFVPHNPVVLVLMDHPLSGIQHLHDFKDNFNAMFIVIILCAFTDTAVEKKNIHSKIAFLVFWVVWSN